MARMSLPLLVLLALAWGAHGLNRLQELYKWSSVDFVYPSSAARSAAIASGDFVPGNAVPLDVDVYQGETGQRVFMTFPRLKPGVPFTVATVATARSAHGGGGSYYGGSTVNPADNAAGARSSAPAVRAFPDLSWHRQGDCDGLVSVFRLQVDQTCGRLWVLDTGRIDILNTFDRICTPKLVVFDIQAGADRWVRKHIFNEDAMQSGSLPVTVAVDVRGASPRACSSAFAYVADVTGYGLVVYDFQADKSWRVNHRHFYPYPTWGNFNIAGTSFDLMDGVLGLALTPVTASGDRRLYFHALASVREAWVSTGVLRNETLFADGANAARDLFRLSEGERPSQAAAQAMDASGVLFFSLLSKNSLNCWVAATGAPYAARGIATLDQDDEALQFAAGLKVVLGRDGSQEVWVLTNRFQKLMSPEGQDPQQENFRVMRASVRHLVKGTKCDARILRPQGAYAGGSSTGAGAGVVFPGPTARPRVRAFRPSSFSPAGLSGAIHPRTRPLAPPPPLSMQSRFDAAPAGPSSLAGAASGDASPTYSSWWLFTFHPPSCAACDASPWPATAQRMRAAWDTRQ